MRFTERKLDLAATKWLRLGEHEALTLFGIGGKLGRGWGVAEENWVEHIIALNVSPGTHKDPHKKSLMVTFAWLVFELINLLGDAL